jgi:homocysteine S-methyltransferase
MPNRRFEDIIPPAELRRFAAGWIERGAQVLGGCCGLSPEHIAALAPLKRQRAHS